MGWLLWSCIHADYFSTFHCEKFWCNISALCNKAANMGLVFISCLVYCNTFEFIAGFRWTPLKWWGYIYLKHQVRDTHVKPNSLWCALAQRYSVLYTVDWCGISCSWLRDVRQVLVRYSSTFANSLYLWPDLDLQRNSLLHCSRWNGMWLENAGIGNEGAFYL